MEQRIFHGDLKPEDLADNLKVHFDRGNLIVQKFSNDETIAVQIKTRSDKTSGGSTALGVVFKSVKDGVLVQVGQQTWSGIVASLGLSAVSAFLNPWNLLNRIDDIAQDIEYMQLTDEVWHTLESIAKSIGNGYELSDKLRRTICAYCLTFNPADEPSCLACGAPLALSQPKSCRHCGFILIKKEVICPNCGKTA